MQRVVTIKRIGVAVAAAAALAGVTASPAAAAIYGPACTARLVPADVGSASCGFDTPTDAAYISVVPQGTVTATLRCTNYGYTTTRTRTVSTTTTWSSGTYGTCTLSLSAVSPGAAAVATAVPTVIIYTGPDPA